MKNINSALIDLPTSKVSSILTYGDKIIGCPHEEGIDYDEGKYCPECPYWKDKDRWDI